jgi:sugar phosphate isomerase/epimerase
MLREIRDLGFEYAELSHGTRISLVPGILEAVAAGEMKISSLHNFCPLPLGVNSASPNLFQFSSERERERDLAVRHTLKTIEFAGKVGAAAVVLHLGSIDMRNYTERMVDMVQKGHRDTPRYEQLCAEMDEKREAKKKPFMDRVVQCLKQIAPEAAARGVLLGAENREKAEELPLDADFKELFKAAGNPALRYWHDTGHAQIKENLGLLPHAMQLASMREFIGGLHVHDVRFPARDHSPPGSGTVDFASLKPSLKPEHIRVFEFSPNMTAEQARAGIAHIFKLWENS